MQYDFLSSLLMSLCESVRFFQDFAPILDTFTLNSNNIGYLTRSQSTAGVGVCGLTSNIN